ncbi:right-handed parallel beta-helix repeat-containing protein [uncultured Proteiniphilum sp.]|uniref:right-handed parallel beta-helix repeat-containing protein n=1 Tax=uncultured Proteiniphilum sp. TaxID=497637 RepID=UPI0026185EB4|nr:right-handed parallel beta-helix repeat-containing protein [uncultured Proteiniphilum sp.]
MNDYLNTEQPNSDAMPAIRAALEQCILNKASTLVLPGGRLYIKRDQAFEKYQFISNNNESLKRIAFDLAGMEDFTVEGNNTELMFSGFISPFNLEECRNVTINNLTIDYTRTFNSEGIIVNKGEGWLDIKFPEDYMYDTDNGTLRFKDENHVYYPYSNLLEFDSKLREPAFQAKDFWLWSPVAAEEIEKGTVRIKRDDLKGTIGNTLVFGASARYNPAFTLNTCEDINIYNVNLYHCGGMGVIAQSSEDIELRKVNVTPTPGSNRMISITADATHFVNCSGYIRMIDCIFENQKDDASNIHGWYMAVESVKDDYTMLLRWKNKGQYGVDFITPHSTLEFVDNETMSTYDRAKVKSVKRLNKEYLEVVMSTLLPKEIKKNHVVAADDAYPEVLIKGCRIQKNRARGLLLGSRARMVIEDNYFHTPGAAILFEGDGNYWYEQSGVRDVIIRNNIFENCNYGSEDWGRACIAVGSGIPNKEVSRYHHNIRVEKNIFKTYDPRILYLYSVDGFIFKNNTIEKTNAYLYTRSENRPFVVTDSSNVEITEK